MENKDLYGILGVSKNATADELKSAYRKLSMKYHPDRQVGKSESERKDAEEKFKDINAAYSVLGDMDKRANYDQFGSVDGQGGFSGFGGGGFDPFSFFRKMGGFAGSDDGGFNPFGFNMGGRQRNKTHDFSRREDGADFHTQVNVSFKESVFGCTREFDFDGDCQCDSCDGTGIKKGSTPAPCQHCHGTGQIIESRRQGMFMSQTISACPHCHGTGVIADTCEKCHGEKRLQKKKTIKVKVPAGIMSGQKLRVRGMGQCGVKGGTDGDLIVFVGVDESEIFQRNGLDIGIELPISPILASLGGKVQVPTIYGYKKIKIEPGSKTGMQLKISGAGIKTSSETGDMIIRLLVEPLSGLTPEQKELLEKLQKTETDGNTPDVAEFMSKAAAFYK